MADAPSAPGAVQVPRVGPRSRPLFIIRPSLVGLAAADGDEDPSPSAASATSAQRRVLASLLGRAGWVLIRLVPDPIAYRSAAAQGRPLCEHARRAVALVLHLCLNL